MDANGPAVRRVLRILDPSDGRAPRRSPAEHDPAALELQRTLMASRRISAGLTAGSRARPSCPRESRLECVAAFWSLNLVDDRVSIAWRITDLLAAVAAAVHAVG